MLKKVGDIIRIHRANIGQYRNYKTFYANIDFGSSWAIFNGPESAEIEIDDVDHLDVNQGNDSDNSSQDSTNIKKFILEESKID